MHERKDRPSQVKNRLIWRLVHLYPVLSDSLLAIVKPHILVCVGAPAAKAVIDKDFRITDERGRWRKGPNGEDALATFHPSYLLRLRSADREAFEHAYAAVLGDFRAVVARADELGIALGTTAATA